MAAGTAINGLSFCCSECSYERLCGRDKHRGDRVAKQGRLYCSCEKKKKRTMWLMPDREEDDDEDSSPVEDNVVDGLQRERCRRRFFPESIPDGNRRNPSEPIETCQSAVLDQYNIKMSKYPRYACSYRQAPRSGKESRRRRVGTITDNVFDHFKNNSGRANLTFEDLYIAVLLIYNDINKYLPGPHFDPPSREKVRAMIQDCDINLDGELNREEFVGFIHQLTADTFTLVSQGLITTLAVAPTVAILTKKATEDLPGVGVVVQRLPTSVYASLVTVAVMLYQKSVRGLE